VTEPTEPVAAMTAPYRQLNNVRENRVPAYRIRHNPARSLMYPWRIERRLKFLWFFPVWEDYCGWPNVETAEQDLQERVAKQKRNAEPAAQCRQVFLYDREGRRI
jgi:hypothetical protein